MHNSRGAEYVNRLPRRGGEERRPESEIDQAREEDVCVGGEDRETLDYAISTFLRPA